MSAHHATAEDLEALEAAADARELKAEDWSASVRWLCRACSEGTPHDHAARTGDEWSEERHVGLAAHSESEVDDLLALWVAGAPGRAVKSAECVLRRPA